MDSSRSKEVDVIRLFALIGLSVVNMTIMAFPAAATLNIPDTLYDQLGLLFIATFFELKFFLLFSFIFGWGFYVQQQLAQAKGYSFYKLYFSRMAGLAVLGFCHAVLVFNGDILVLYAVLGCLLWCFKQWTPARLVKTTLWMIPLCILVWLITFGFMEETVSKAMLLQLFDSHLSKPYGEAVVARFEHWFYFFSFVLCLQGVLVMGAFLLGLAAAKVNFFSEGNAIQLQLKKRLPLFLITALPLNAFYAAVSVGFVPESHPIAILGFIVVIFAAPMLSLVYLYTLMWFARNVELPDFFILAGQNSLSVYVLQGVIAGLVFAPYGLGLFDQFAYVPVFFISLLIALASMLVVSGCAYVFGAGPLEPILRSFSKPFKKT